MSGELGGWTRGGLRPKSEKISPGGAVDELPMVGDLKLLRVLLWLLH